MSPTKINRRRCIECGVAPGIRHRRECTYPERTAQKRRELALVYRTPNASPALMRLETSLEQACISALAKWIRLGGRL